MAEQTRREKLTSIIERVEGLNSKLYIGHEIQHEVFEKREDLIKEFCEIVKPRVDLIVGLLREMPDGAWKKPRRRGDPELRSVCKYAARKNRPRYRCEVVGANLTSFSCLIGEDDGAPERDWFSMPTAWLVENDDEKVKEILWDVAWKECEKTLKDLQQRAEAEAKCLEAIGFGIEEFAQGAK